MIFVTLGTQDKSFDRLLKAIDKKIEEKKIKDKVIVQAGYTKYESKNMEIFDLVSMEKFNKLIKDCDVLITHGGVGSILTGLTNDKKVIAAARLSKYKEHTNDHQKQIISEFARRGYILELKDFSTIDKVINKAKKFAPKKYESNNQNMVNLIENYIKEDNNTSWFNKLSSFVICGFFGVINFILSLLLWLLFIKLGINEFVSIITSSIIVMLGTYFMYKNDIDNNSRLVFFINRLLCIVIDVLMFYYFSVFGLFSSKIYSALIVVFISFIFSCFFKMSED